MDRIVKANLISGLSLGLLVPITWPIVIYLVEDKIPAWDTYKVAAISISLLAIVVGLVGSIVVGIPTLKWLEKYKLNKPMVAGSIGFVITWVVFYLLWANNEQAESTPFWFVISYFSLLGALCGVLASKLSSPNKALNTDSAKNAAPVS